MNPSPDLVAAALECAARGWPVIPLHSPMAQGCTCGRADCASPAKHPRTAHGLKDASRDPATIREWWSCWPDANIGMVTGPESGIIVVDVDGVEGRKSLADLERQEFTLPATLTVTTGRADGGEHRYFRLPSGVDIHNDQSGKIGPHIDVRGTGGYAVCPPSGHASGKPYRFIDPSVPLAPLPEWVVHRLTIHRLGSNQQNLKLALRPAAAKVGNKTQRGHRTNSIVSKAGWLNKRGADQKKIESILLETNTQKCSPPLPEEKVKRIANEIPERYANNAGRFTEEPEELEESEENEESEGEMYSIHKTVPRQINLLALKTHVKAALDFCATNDVQGWRTPMFEFARFCKASPEVAAMSDLDAMSIIEKVLRQLNAADPNRDPWLDFFPDAGVSGEAQIDFQHSWRNVRYLPGHDMLAEAQRLAEEFPVYSSEVRGPLFQRFIDLSYHLQILQGTLAIFLPGRKLAPLLGCSHATVSHLVKAAIQDRLLEKTAPASFGPSGRSAARYKFNLNALKAGTDEQNATVLSISETAPG